jgi:hypothetical protein
VEVLSVEKFFPDGTCALAPIDLTVAAGVALFSLMVALSKLALGAWHESEVGVET